MKDSLFLGIDGGGTKCKARLEDAGGRLLGEGLAGPANPVRGIEQTIDSVISASKKAFNNAGVELDALSQTQTGIGLAGVNLPSLMKKINQWNHPFASMRLTTDLHIACLGAHAGQDGAVIITGTGFCAGSLINSKVTEIGGYGFLLGDTASGAKLGLNALRHCLRFFDGLVKNDALIEALLDLVEVKDAKSLVEKCVDAKPAFFAQFAPCVLQQAVNNTAYAVKLVEESADYVNRVANQLLIDNHSRISMIGGIAEPLTQWLDPALQNRLNKPVCPPEAGAIYLARQQQFQEVNS